MNGDPEERFVTANGLRHHVLVWNGGGELVVLCHGFLDIAWSFDAIGRRLAEAGYRALAFDWRGHGESDWIGPGGYYHFADYLLDLDALLPQFGEGPYHLVGHSMGASIVSMYAGTRPERLASLVAIEGLGIPETVPMDETPLRARDWLDAVHRMRSRSPRPLRDLDEALARMRIQNPDLPEDLGCFLAEKSTRETPEGRIFRFDPLHRTPSPSPFRRDVYLSYLRRITAPVLVVLAERGHRLPDEATRLAAIRSVRTAEIPKVGHMVHWFAPDALAAEILDHLRRSTKEGANSKMAGVPFT